MMNNVRSASSAQVPQTFPIPGGDVNIVIIDDNLINVKLTEALIGPAGRLRARQLHRSAVGLAHCETNDFDLLIVVDYMMPALDGIELIR